MRRRCRLARMGYHGARAASGTTAGGAQASWRGPCAAARRRHARRAGDSDRRRDPGRAGNVRSTGHDTRNGRLRVRLARYRPAQRGTRMDRRGPDELPAPDSAASEHVLLLETNIDDQSPEQLAYVAERLLAGGALDVWWTPIGMKKGRGATMLSALVRLADESAAVETMFRETTAWVSVAGRSSAGCASARCTMSQLHGAWCKSKSSAGGSPARPRARVRGLRAGGEGA